ncbi:MAG: tRNA ((6)-L-threonylcarbamoyladenosine(37)-C(2))-methylthiotransferase MtaB [Ignavibacteria bacterium]|nr:tRNA ((6)-L-threonylcarbamoyladenosine(37)-C(2))-methylthiotransferase MtaB [Ignavibacteria bacterium]
MRLSFINIGCKVNFAEISEIADEFVREGADIVEFGKESDVVLINTCTVTHHADADCRKIIRRAARTSPEASIIVTGCYAQINPDEIAAIDGVAAVVGMNDKFHIRKIIDDLKHNGAPAIYMSIHINDEFHGACSADNDTHTRVFFKIQDGCDYSCSYCTIPLARGGNRSMSIDEISRRLKQIEVGGYREIILSGINLGDYHYTPDKRFIDVLRHIENTGTNMRVRISSIEPNLLTNEILELVSNSRIICPHFHIPLQSGSPQILGLMRRRYKASYFEELINKIKHKIPDCCIGVDVIAGFPGETDELFAQTYNLLESLPVSYLHAFTYSERANTDAASFSTQVSPTSKKERTLRLRLLSEEKKMVFYKSQIDTERFVIPEVISQETGFGSGWTENYVRVRFPINELQINYDKEASEPVKVKLLEISGSEVLAKIC